jgi:predicted anti-sigma-YlaC factor YlaD
MLARLPEVEAMLQRSRVLDKAYDHGALHEFALVWFDVASRAPDRAVIDRHYQRALELSAGQRASLYVAYAIVTALPSQERQQFHSLMQEALAVDPDALPGARLLNAIAQRRAGWLLSRSSELFLE